MKKILGLLSSFTLLTAGVTPLMAMMPNNKNKVPSLEEKITTINIEYINKVDKETIFNKLKEKKETFLSQPIFIENLEIIDIFLEKKDFNYRFVHGISKIKLKENSNICIKNNNKWIQVPENIIYTINFYTRNKNYVSSIKFYNWKPSFYIYK
ncbi:hypothetical protein [Spiroplasma citri]|uniref:Hypothetical transmembrane protein n=1 Tax=Spiroplasma citri TaxID=2133 RepID=Q14KA7_SPICI|nr:hypothetical protein [Spiroplasma citri]APE74469.1 hypothetical protein SCITRI_00570 [Spiroplasma citri]QED24389.1 hypothetical protein FRX96_02655 [Spiroplasma citri]QIA66655.1 hypothetical protein GMI18_02660 [Spiroplasma citri]QIA68539.1 hypothetical protein GL298_02780 [Spiroplasma citri]QIA70412.1 hypothetical protein GL981_02780 [Spiroplasma citri]